MFNLTAGSEFIIEVLGEKLRGLLALRTKRIEAAIEREEGLYKLAVEAEAAQMKAEAELRNVRQNYREQVTRLGGVGFAPVGGIHRDPEQHIRNLRALRASHAEVAWLTDAIIPSQGYKLNRGDLALFGSFSLPGEEYPQLVASHNCLA